MTKIEFLLAKDCGDSYQIQGITYNNAPSFDNDLVALKASFLAIQEMKQLLALGKNIHVSKTHPYAEVVPSDFIVEEEDELATQKRIALNDINNKMLQNIFNMSVLDSMDYLDAYMKLLAAGIFISDANREDKYFEIIEAAQTNEDPGDLSPDATFEQEQDFLQKKTAFTNAQSNLNTLEQYLNAYDKLIIIGFIHKILKEAKTDVENSTTVDAIRRRVEEYNNKIDSYINPNGNT